MTLYDDHLPGYPPISACRHREYVIGAAWPAVRRQIAAQACCEAESGIVVFPGAVVSPTAVLGAHSHVGYNAVLCHGVQLGAFVNVCPLVGLGGDVIVEDDVFIGIGASVIHRVGGGIRIGAGATIGAGAVVLDDVEAGTTVVGVPARPIQRHRRFQGWDLRPWPDDASVAR